MSGISSSEILQMRFGRDHSLTIGQRHRRLMRQLPARQARPFFQVNECGSLAHQIGHIRIRGDFDIARTGNRHRLRRPVPALRQMRCNRLENIRRPHQRILRNIRMNRDMIRLPPIHSAAAVIGKSSLIAAFFPPVEITEAFNPNWQL